MTWFSEYYEIAGKTDRLIERENHAELMAVGLLGEAGSVLAELKKGERDKDAYPEYRRRIVDEMGDLLWYFVRLISVLAPEEEATISELALRTAPPIEDPLSSALELGASAGALLSCVGDGAAGTSAGDHLQALMNSITSLAAGLHVDLETAAKRNLQKTRSRWPEERHFHGLFDDGFEEEEQLPRRLDIEFREVTRAGKKVAILRCNGLNFGDRLTDNIQYSDFYRYHDIFHFAYAVFLGWSPVTRSLLRCKRKSKPEVDEAQDGARAAIIEEAVSAIVFSRAKKLRFYDGLGEVDYDLLKTIQEFLGGFEVENIPLWQWEKAIIEGYRVFRALRDNRGGYVTLDIDKRELRYRVLD